MLTEIEAHREQIAELCRRYGVRRLELFGSAARRTDFDPASSDLDFLIEFSEEHPPTLSDFFTLQQELTELLGYEIDLVTPRSLRNPYIRASVEQSRELVYAA